MYQGFPQMVKNLLAMQETQVQSLGQEDPVEKEMVAHSSILAWRIPWTEEPGGLESMGLQRVRHDLATKLPPPCTYHSLLDAFFYLNLHNLTSWDIFHCPHFFFFLRGGNAVCIQPSSLGSAHPLYCLLIALRQTQPNQTARALLLK